MRTTVQYFTCAQAGSLKRGPGLRLACCPCVPVGEQASTRLCDSFLSVASVTTQPVMERKCSALVFPSSLQLA